MSQTLKRISLKNNSLSEIQIELGVIFYLATPWRHQEDKGKAGGGGQGHKGQGLQGAGTAGRDRGGGTGPWAETREGGNGTIRGRDRGQGLRGAAMGPQRGGDSGQGLRGGAGDRAARGGDSGQGRGGSTTPCPAPLTPAQAEEAFADEAVPEAACHGHVGLPGLGEHPAEGRQEEEMQEGGHQRAHHLDRAAGWVRRGGCPVTRSQACPGGGAR